MKKATKFCAKCLGITRTLKRFLVVGFLTFLSVSKSSKQTFFSMVKSGALPLFFVIQDSHARNKKIKTINLFENNLLIAKMPPND